MIPTIYNLNGREGRALSAASVNVLEITGNPLISGGKTTSHDVLSFLFIHFAPWETVKKLASRAKAFGSSETWTEAVLDWSLEALEGMGPLATGEASMVAARMMEDGFKTRATVEQEDGEDVGKFGDRTPPTGSPL